MTTQTATLNQDDRPQLEWELRRAAEIQATLLPREYPALPGYSLAAQCIPARYVGGDFYDWQASPETLSVTVGDVMGKGVPAALLMAAVRATLRAFGHVLGPGGSLTAASKSLATYLEQCESFVTLFHCQLNVQTGELRYADAGHGYVLLKRADGSSEEIKPRGFPLGVMGEMEYREGRTFLLPGDALVVFSDGLADLIPTDATDPYGLLTVARELDGCESAPAMVERLTAWSNLYGPHPDDLTVLALYRKPE